MNFTDLPCSLVAMSSFTAMRFKVEESTFFWNYMKNSVPFWIFRAFVIILRKFKNNLALHFSYKNICQEHYSLRAVRDLGKFCHGP